MGRNIQYFIFYLFLLLLVLCVTIKYRTFDQDHHKLNPSQQTNEVQTIVVFRSSKDFGTRKEHCNNAFLPNDTAILWNNGWQMVENNTELYIYSAHLDKRLDSKFVRIIAIEKGNHSRKLFCRTWNRKAKSSISEIEQQELWVKKWDSAKSGQYYQPLLLSCFVPADTIAVSVVSKPCKQPRNVMNLKPSGNPQNKLKDFVICLKPLNFQPDRSLKILEWLELQFLLGVDKVFAYVYNVHPHIWKVLMHYEKIGKVALKYHTLPGIHADEIFIQKQIHNVWQKRRHEMVIYNDCFYRHIHSHKFLVNMDLDEAIVPVIHDSWADLLKHISTKYSKVFRSASIAVANVYFFSSFGEVSDTSIPDFMHMQRHVYRSANFTPPGFAQKSFFTTNSTLMVSNHYALQALRTDSRIMSSIPIHLAHLHHYREDCPPLMEEDCKNNYMKFRKKDTLLWKFKDKLIKNVQSKIQELKLVESLKNSSQT